MKISVIIPSRKRVRGLSATLTTLDRLSSKKHEITYGICCDLDDLETQDFCKEIQKEIPLAYKTGERPKSLGSLYNGMAELMPADLYFLLVDDMLCLTPDWDDIAAKAAEETPHGVFFWSHATNDALWAIIAEKWRKAADCLFTDHYPFWYDDLAMVEQYAMATGEQIQKLPIIAHDTPGKTHRMRDLPFWNDFFLFTRQWRVERGKEIAKNLGIVEPLIGEELLKLLNKEWCCPPKEYLEQIEANQGDKSEPDANYLASKKRAEIWMETGRDPWN